MSAQNNGGPAFPTIEECYEQKYAGEGMSLRDYAAIKFTSTWTKVLGTIVMKETREEIAGEALRLGLIQADAFLKAREA